VSLVLMALALGTDAFSVSLGLGMQHLRLRRVALTGSVIGLFHIGMPFFGIVLGQAISNRIGHITTLAGGLLLVGIGAQMFFTAWHHDQAKQPIRPIGFGLFLLSFTVSLVSF